MPQDANKPFERAVEEGPSREQLDHEYAPALEQQTQAPATLPSVWKDGEGGDLLPGKRVHVIRPDAGEVAAFSNPRANVCGACRFFDLENGRKEIVRQRFGERLVKEFEWKLRHLGASPDAIGLCGQAGGEMAVSFVSKSCDHFRPKRG